MTEEQFSSKAQNKGNNAFSYLEEHSKHLAFLKVACRQDRQICRQSNIDGT